jgi:hypothetical protein
MTRARHLGVRRGHHEKRAIAANQASPCRVWADAPLCRKNRHSRVCRIFRQDGGVVDAVAGHLAGVAAGLLDCRCLSARARSERVTSSAGAGGRLRQVPSLLLAVTHS